MRKPPASGQIKINVDESFFGNSGRKSIDGVFRDSEGKVCLQFGKKVHVNSAIYREILAFGEWILVAMVSRWASSHSFVFKSNSKSFVLDL